MEQDPMSFFEQVRQKQDAILQRWLRMHRGAVELLVLAAALVEAVVGLVSVQSSSFQTSSLWGYLIKYLLIPSGVNLCILAVLEALSRWMPVSVGVRRYAVSLGMLAVSLVLYTVHSIFSAAAALFLVTVLLTAIYGDYLLTTVTAALSMAGLLFSGLFLHWDGSKAPVQANTVSPVNFLLEALILLGGYLLCLAIIRYERAKNEAILRAEEEQYHLEQALRLDTLTQVYNRKALWEALDRLRAEQAGAALAMMDLDRFKQLNDTYGHLRGDQCLSRFARLLREVAGERPIFRYGGDEFCILFPGERGEQAAQICREICGAMERSELHRRYRMGISIGVAEFSPEMEGQALVARADQALYRAKSAGGGVVVAEPELLLSME